MFKILLNRKRLNNIANVARKNLKSSLHYTIPSVTQAVLSYDLSQAVRSDSIILEYQNYIGVGVRYTSLYATENPENILHIPDAFGINIAQNYSGSNPVYVPSIISYPNCSYIGYLAFVAFSNLQSAFFNKCEIIGSRAFEKCTNLKDISFPKCKRIKFAAFNNCYNLQEVSFPVCTDLDAFVFKYCSILQSVNMPMVKSIPFETFQGMTLLREAAFQECIVVGSYAFDHCVHLNSIELSNCLYLGKYCFRSCVSLTSLFLSKCQYVGEHAFENAINLETISIGSCQTICDYAFRNCEKLERIILLGDCIPKTNGSKIFENSPLALDYSGVRSCKMYVQESLFSQYVEAMSSIINVEALAVYE